MKAKTTAGTKARKRNTQSPVNAEEAMTRLTICSNRLRPDGPLIRFCEVARPHFALYAGRWEATDEYWSTYQVPEDSRFDVWLID